MTADDTSGGRRFPVGVCEWSKDVQSAFCHNSSQRNPTATTIWVQNLEQALAERELDDGRGQEGCFPYHECSVDPWGPEKCSGIHEGKIIFKITPACYLLSFCQVDICRDGAESTDGSIAGASAKVKSMLPSLSHHCTPDSHVLALKQTNKAYFIQDCPRQSTNKILMLLCHNSWVQFGFLCHVVKRQIHRKHLHILH